jgi:hypothetical protein
MTNWLGRSNKAIAILRVSSHRQKDGVSHEAQESEIRAYAEEHELALAQVVPIIESAKDSENRDKYHAAIEWALKSKIRHVVWYMADREVRNFTDLERMEKHIRRDDLVVHYVRERRVLHSKSPAADFSMREIEAWRDKQLSRAISTKVTDATRIKAESGWYPGNWPPAGYRNEFVRGEDGRARKRGTIIVIDPARVPQVRREFELRAEGWSIEEIRKRILEEKLAPPGAYHRSDIEQRLKNPFYGGRFTWQGKEYQGKHELFIPPAILAAVNGSFGNKQRGKRRPPDPSRGMFAGGWLHCHECGCQIVYERKVKRYRSGAEGIFDLYRCTNGKRLHASLKGLYVREEVIWEQFGNALDEITLTPALAAEIAQELNRRASSLAAVVRSRVEKLRAERKSLEEHEDRAYSDYVKGLLDDEMYRRQVHRIREKRTELTRAIEETQLITGSPKETAESVFELCKEAKSLWIQRSPWERKEFLEKVLSNPRLDGPTLRYDWKGPFKALAKMTQGKEWRPHLDDFLTLCLMPAA